CPYTTLFRSPVGPHPVADPAPAPPPGVGADPPHRAAALSTAPQAPAATSPALARAAAGSLGCALAACHAHPPRSHCPRTRGSRGDPHRACTVDVVGAAGAGPGGA